MSFWGTPGGFQKTDFWLVPFVCFVLFGAFVQIVFVVKLKSKKRLWTKSAKPSF